MFRGRTRISRVVFAARVENIQSPDVLLFSARSTSSARNWQQERAKYRSFAKLRAIIRKSRKRREKERRRRRRRRRFLLHRARSRTQPLHFEDRNLLRPDTLRLRTKRLRRDFRIGTAERGRIVSRGFRLARNWISNTGKRPTTTTRVRRSLSALRRCRLFLYSLHFAD